MKATAIRIETYAAYRTLAAVENAARALGKALVIVAAPVIGLAFIVALPFAGLVALAWVAIKALRVRRPRVARALRNVALFLAAPFIGLAYVVALPFVGIGAIAWVALKRAS